MREKKAKTEDAEIEKTQAIEAKAEACAAIETKGECSKEIERDKCKKRAKIPAFDCDQVLKEVEKKKDEIIKSKGKQRFLRMLDDEAKAETKDSKLYH